MITLDSDFHALLAHSNASWPSVVRIRIERLKAQACAELIMLLIKDYQAELDSGVMMTVQSNRVRVHHLPLF